MRASPPAYAVFARQQIKLLGYDLALASAPNPSALVTPHFQSIGPTNEDYTVFLHLLDRSRRLVAQHDGQPKAGSAPTSLWQQGEVIADAHLVNLGRSLVGQQLQVVPGMYRLETGQRLPVLDIDGREVGDSLLLGTIGVP